MQSGWLLIKRRTMAVKKISAALLTFCPILLHGRGMAGKLATMDGCRAAVAAVAGISWKRGRFGRNVHKRRKNYVKPQKIEEILDAEEGGVFAKTQ